MLGLWKESASVAFSVTVNRPLRDSCTHLNIFGCAVRSFTSKTPFRMTANKGRLDLGCPVPNLRVMERVLCRFRGQDGFPTHKKMRSPSGCFQGYPFYEERVSHFDVSPQGGTGLPHSMTLTRSYTPRLLTCWPKEDLLPCIAF